MDKIPRISDELTPFFFLGLRREAGDFFFFFLFIAEIIAHLESELNEAQCVRRVVSSKTARDKQRRIEPLHIP